VWLSAENCVTRVAIFWGGFRVLNESDRKISGGDFQKTQM
jgi:hypothetical protein